MSDHEHVLTCEKAYVNCTTYHLPDPDDPDRPRCHNAGKSDTWRRRDREMLPARMSLCRVCDPDDTVERTNGGEQLAAKLRDPDVSEPEDLVTDGGVSAVDVLEAAGSVWVVAGNNGGTVHADRDCQHLNQSPRAPRRVETAGELPLRAGICRPCAPAEVLEGEELVADGGDQCAECGVTTSGAFLVEVDGEVVCEDCAGVRECVRCGRSTDETTLAGDPKCRECQKRKRQESESRPLGQGSLDDFSTDGGVESPEILDVVPAPAGSECALFGSGPEPEFCDNEAAYLFVYDSHLAEGSRDRHNALACDGCFTPPVKHEPITEGGQR